MKLIAGERYVLTGEENFLRVERGALEVYAVTRSKADFRQEMLMQLAAGEAAFPSFDEFEGMDVSIYALEETELTLVPFAAAAPEELAPLMNLWFGRLVQLPRFASLADRGDDVLKKWRKGTALLGAEDLPALLGLFRQNEAIFAMLQGTAYQVEDKRLKKRLELRLKQKYLLLDASIGELLNEDSLLAEEVPETGSTPQLGEVSFIVRRALKALSMPAEGVQLPSEITKKMDQVTLLRRLSQKGNMQLRLLDLKGDWWQKDSGVIIGYQEREQGSREMVLLLPKDPASYLMVSHRQPEGVPLTEELVRTLAKDAFQCYGGFPLRKLKVMDLLRFMFHQCWKQDYRTIMAVSFFAGLIPLVTPIITETIFQDILPILDREGLVTVTQVMMVTSFTMAALSVIRSVAIMRITSRLDMSVEAALWGRLLMLPEKFFRRFTSGELANRMKGMEAVKGVISGGFVSSVFNTVFSFWSLILMCWYSLKLTAAAVAVWVVWCLVTAFIYRRVIGFQRSLIAAGNKQAGLVQQIFAGLAKFRVHGAEAQAYHLWSKAFGESWKWNLALRWQGNYNSIIGSIQPFVLTMLLYYIAVYGMQDTVAGTGGKVVASTGIGYAQFLAFESAYTSFNGTLNSLIPLVGQFFTIQPHIENLRPILEETPEITEDKLEAEPLTGTVEVSHLTFAYGENKPEVLKDVSFKVTAGENLAIVGRSGCGKSTLVRLLLGFEQPKTGAIYYDGQSLAELSLPSVRSQMGVVLQNGQLMTGDIFTNIVGQTALTQEDAWAAAEAAGIADDIRAMPMGMQTVISEGSSNISGGQRQRIMIARALAARPAILIFDEATSALDNKAQAIVTESLDRLSVTRIVIAHRLSTIRKCDRILVMDQGRIAESGTFDELVAKGGLFAKLVKRQVA